MWAATSQRVRLAMRTRYVGAERWRYCRFQTLTVQDSVQRHLPAAQGASASSRVARVIRALACRVPPEIARLPLKRCLLVRALPLRRVQTILHTKISP